MPRFAVLYSIYFFMSFLNLELDPWGDPVEVIYPEGMSRVTFTGTVVELRSRSYPQSVDTMVIMECSFQHPSPYFVEIDIMDISPTGFIFAPPLCFYSPYGTKQTCLNFFDYLNDTSLASSSLVSSTMGDLDDNGNVMLAFLDRVWFNLTGNNYPQNDGNAELSKHSGKVLILLLFDLVNNVLMIITK